MRRRVRASIGDRALGRPFDSPTPLSSSLESPALEPAVPRGLERTRTHTWSAASLQVDGMTAKITTSSIGNSPLLQEAPAAGVPTSTAPRAPRNSADREFGQTYSYPVRGAAGSLRGTRHAARTRSSKCGGVLRSHVAAACRGVQRQHHHNLRARRRGGESTSSDSQTYCSSSAGLALPRA